MTWKDGDQHLLLDACKMVGDAFMKQSNIRNLVIDMALVYMWFNRIGEDTVGPTRVLMLESVYTLLKKTIEHKQKVYSSITYLTIETFWTQRHCTVNKHSKTGPT